MLTNCCELLFSNNLKVSISIFKLSLIKRMLTNCYSLLYSHFTLHVCDAFCFCQQGLASRLLPKCLIVELTRRVRGSRSPHQLRFLGALLGEAPPRCEQPAPCGSGHLALAFAQRCNIYNNIYLDWKSM